MDIVHLIFFFSEIAHILGLEWIQGIELIVCRFQKIFIIKGILLLRTYNHNC